MLSGDFYAKSDKHDFGRDIYFWKNIGIVSYKITLEDMARNRYGLVYGEKAAEKLPYQWKSVKFFIDSIIHFHPSTYGVPTYLPHYKFGVFCGERFTPAVQNKKQNGIVTKTNFNIQISVEMVIKLIIKLLQDYRKVYAFSSRFEEFVFVRTCNKRLSKTYKLLYENGRPKTEQVEVTDNKGKTFFKTRFVYEDKPIEGLEFENSLGYEKYLEYITYKNIDPEYIAKLKDYILRDWYGAREEWLLVEWRKFCENHRIKMNEGWSDLTKYMTPEEKLKKYWKYASKEEKVEILKENGMTLDEKIETYWECLDLMEKKELLEELSEENKMIIEMIKSEVPPVDLTINPDMLSEAPKYYVRKEYNYKEKCKKVYVVKTLHFGFEDLNDDIFTYKWNDSDEDDESRIEKHLYPMGSLKNIEQNKGTITLTFRTPNHDDLVIHLNKRNQVYDYYLDLFETLNEEGYDYVDLVSNNEVCIDDLE